MYANSAPIESTVITCGVSTIAPSMLVVPAGGVFACSYPPAVRILFRNILQLVMVK
jgi:hypothetical protein